MRPRLLLLPITAAATLAAANPAAALFVHTVTPGESLYSIAQTDGLSVAALAAANGLSSDSMLESGASVAIPPQGTTSTYTPASTYSPSSTSTGTSSYSSSSGTSSYVSSTSTVSTGAYTVQPGDTLSAIAARNGTTVSSLAAANGLDPAGLLLSGAEIRLTAGTGSSSSTSSTEPVSYTTSAYHSAPAGSGGPYPTQVRLSAGDVAQTAAGEGISGSLADAIGWQESGFNNGLVSPTGAVGVMQIEPGTWAWIQGTLTAGTPLSPYSAHDNVRGGALLLRSLLSSTGGDPAMAAAAYYQGLSSVREHGLYTDTQQYVRNVMELRHQFGG